jgi:hypothetical protein
VNATSRAKPLRAQISVSFDQDDYKALADFCNKRGESLGAFIRFATLQRAASLGLFSAERKKVFGGQT